MTVPMKYDPATGEQNPRPCYAADWRAYHGTATAWLFNPWTGKRRDARDVGSDINGFLISPPNESVCLGTVYMKELQRQFHDFKPFIIGECSVPFGSVDVLYKDGLIKLNSRSEVLNWADIVAWAPSRRK